MFDDEDFISRSEFDTLEQYVDKIKEDLDETNSIAIDTDANLQNLIELMIENQKSFIDLLEKHLEEIKNG